MANDFPRFPTINLLKFVKLCHLIVDSRIANRIKIDNSFAGFLSMVFGLQFGFCSASGNFVIQKAIQETHLDF